MSTTLLVLTFLIASLVVQWIAWGVLLKLGLMWARTEGVTLRQLIFATVATVVAQGALTTLMLLLITYRPVPSSLTADVLLSFASLLLPLVIIRFLFRTTLLRSIQAFLPTLLVPIIAYVLLAFVMKPFLFEAFVVSSNSMAPTLRGVHWRGTCPQCGNANFCTPQSPEDSRFGEPPLMICEHNFHMLPFAGDPDSLVTERIADRMMVAKYRTPQRWDLIAFRVPSNPQQIYVMRLVGLPGETIVIKDGGAWADGKRLTPPPELKNIAYLDALPNLGNWPLTGTDESPAELGDDECFVLGDFSASAMDSRMWQAASDRPSYALPQGNILGVVSLIYWPPHRWREF